MKPGDEAYEALCATLREEAQEQVERIGSALLEIEQGVDQQRLSELLEQSFREAHNLKGAAGSLGFGLTSALAHAIESVLGRLRQMDPQASLEAFDILHQGLSVVETALAAGPEATTDRVVTSIIERLQMFQSRPRPSTPTASPGRGTRRMDVEERESELAARVTELPAPTTVGALRDVLQNAIPLAIIAVVTLSAAAWLFRRRLE